MTADKTFDAFVFDLDGTLLDTLPDLVVVTNEVLTRFGLPTHSRDEILAMVGNGLRSLISCRKTFPKTRSSASSPAGKRLTTSTVKRIRRFTTV